MLPYLSIISQFVVLMRTVAQSVANTNTLSSLISIHTHPFDLIGGKIGANGDIHGPGGEWVSVYYGPETLYLTTTLVADSDYQCRVFAVNCQGICSDPSPVQSFSTLRRAEASAGGPGPSQSQVSIVGGLGAISARYIQHIHCTHITL